MQSRRSAPNGRHGQPSLPFAESVNVLSDRVPPQNLEAERGVLGAILLDNNVLHDIVSILRPDDFYRDAHREMYLGVVEMYNDGARIDAVTLADHLERKGVYKQIGGDDLLAEVANSIPHAAGARYHASIVQQKAMTRKWIEASCDIINKAYSNQYTAKQLQEEAEKTIYAIADDRATTASSPVASVMEKIMANIELAKGGEVKGISTGIGSVDRLIKGLMPEKLYVIAARTGEGKTALALSMAQHAGLNGYATLFISLEMSEEELGNRWIASLAKIDSQRLIDNAKFTDHEQAEIAKAAAIMITKGRIHVSDSPNQSLIDITACARRIKQRDNLELVVVDYMGLINESRTSRSENRTEVVGRISRGMKMLARELKVPVIALHQLNRESAKEKREPKLHDLRESGSVEQDSDVVFLLHSLMEESDTEGQIVAIVAKNRGGPRGRCTLYYNKKFNTFELMARDDQIQDGSRIGYDEFDNPDAAPFNTR